MRLKGEIEEMPDATEELNGDVKENGLLRRVNGRLRRSKTDKNGEEDEENRDDKGVDNVEGDDEGKNGKEGEVSKEAKKVDSSEGEEVKKTRTRRAVNNRILGKAGA